VILAVGTRLQDFTTGSWTAFAPDARLICLNAGRHDAAKHHVAAVVGDAKVGLKALGRAGRLQGPCRLAGPCAGTAATGMPMSRGTPS
jgi:TPP-dependent trihydroxycyclohexane-1,2-dione (THcHDO) dehydratase